MSTDYPTASAEATMNNKSKRNPVTPEEIASRIPSDPDSLGHARKCVARVNQLLQFMYPGATHDEIAHVMKIDSEYLHEVLHDESRDLWGSDTNRIAEGLQRAVQWWCLVEVGHQIMFPDDAPAISKCLENSKKRAAANLDDRTRKTRRMTWLVTETPQFRDS